MLLKPNLKKGRNKIEVDKLPAANCGRQFFDLDLVSAVFFRFGFNSPGYYFSKISICRPTANPWAVRIVNRKKALKFDKGQKQSRPRNRQNEQQKNGNMAKTEK